jgi:hypothetical protein
VRDGKLYILFFHPLHALAASSDGSSHLCELWHRGKAHVHHGALGGMGEVVTGVPTHSIRMCAESVRLVSLPRLFSPAMTVGQLGHWI